MGKQELKDRFSAKSIALWDKKIRALAALEANIQAQIEEFIELYGVKILDVNIYDPDTGEIQFETDL